MERGSQHGEDDWIMRHVPLPDQGVFVEVGGADGLENSTTIRFEDKGWTGVIVEPDHRFHDRLRANRKCIIDTRAVSRFPTGAATFRLNDNPTWSGFMSQGGVPDHTVKVVTLEDLLDGHGIGKIHLLSIDTEGTELDVVNSFKPLRHVPDVIMIEWFTVGQTPKENETMWEMSRHPYRCVLRTEINLVFVRNDISLTG